MQIDVTDLILDPDVGGASFRVIRRREAVGANGVAVLTEIDMGMQIGSVFPTGEQSLTRAEAYSTDKNTIAVVTKFRLYEAGVIAGKKYQPDLVVWQGTRYIVNSVDAFSDYGPGFQKADCVAFDFNVNEPSVKPPYVGRFDFSDPAQSALIGFGAR